MDCKHIYEKRAIVQHMKSKGTSGRCPMTGKLLLAFVDEFILLWEEHDSLVRVNLCDDLLSGCPKKLNLDKVECDPYLLIEIDEMRSLNKQRARAGADIIEDFTELEDE